MGWILVGLSRIKLLIILGIVTCCWLVPLTAGAGPARQTTAPPPPNDNFADAEVIASLPFDTYQLDFSGAIVEAGEPTSHCAVNGSFQTVWYSYAQEGSYNATLTTTTVDGRIGSRTRTIAVENHDVVITKLTAPQSARAGQARTISAGVVSKFRDERVRVTLYRSVSDPYSPWQYVTDLTQVVPRGTNTKPTKFDFSYLFTATDAQTGKLSFPVVAELEAGKRDLTPNNNTAISLPTKVSGALAAAASDDAAPVEDGRLYLPVITSHE